MSAALQEIEPQKQRMEPILACKHGNNGWRIEGPAS